MALTQVPIELSSTPGIVDNSNATAITIDSSENVGIGTASPSKELHVMGASHPEIRLQNTSNNYALDLKVNDTVGEVKASSDMAFLPGGSEAMRLDTSGNLLVGTTSLAVSSSTGSVTGSVINSTGLFEAAKTGTVMELNRLTADGAILNFRKDGSTAGSIGTIASDLYIAEGNSGLRFDGENNQILPSSTTASTDGTCNLGAASARFKDLYLSGDATHGTTPSSSAAGAFTEAVGRTTYSRGSGTGGFSHLKFINGNGTVGTVTTSGSATAYNTSSDYRLKENVVAMSGATERLKQLNPSRFNFIADADTTVDGFLAHEVADVVPEAISGTKDAVDSEGNPVYQGIDQSKLVPLLVATIQELEARITQLENN